MSSTGSAFSAEDEAYFAGALRRINRTMLVLPLLLLPWLWLSYPRALAISFVCGSAIAIVNFYWLKRIVNAFADRIASGGRASGTGIVLRFFLRYALIGAIAYVIIKGSAYSVYGLVAGLSLPVGAILIEAGYEVYLALRRRL